jgi:hypothetical protein
MELGDFLDEVVMDIEEEGEAWDELIDLQASFQGHIDIGHPIVMVQASSCTAVAPASRM